MRTRWIAGLLAGAACLLGVTVSKPAAAQAALQQQGLVDRATLTLQDMLGGPQDGDRLATLRRAKAVMICPRVFRAGIVFGGSGGDCVLLARDGGGSWSDPAFFHMGSVSFGLQLGVQDAEVIMMIMTDRGLGALMDDVLKLGGEANVSVATISAGVESATTATLHPDIIVYTSARGLYGGATVSGSALTTNTAWNQIYYGQAFAARQIVLQMQVNNPAADPLRAALSRYGAPTAAPTPYASQGPMPQPPAYAPPQGGSYGQPPSYAQPTSLQPGPAAVQQQSLPPPR